MPLSARIAPNARAAAAKAGSEPGPEPQYTQIRFRVLMRFSYRHAQARSLCSGKSPDRRCFWPKNPLYEGPTGPMSDSHIRSADRMKRDVSADGGGALFRTLVRLW